MKRAGRIERMTEAQASVRSTGRPFGFKTPNMHFTPTRRARTLDCSSGAARAGGQG